jgi:drug/metabolite transporter (DMT)-like permease
LTEGSPQGARTRPSALRLYTLIGLMVSFWALNFLVGKVALREFPPLLLAGLRTSLAGILIVPLYAWRRDKEPWKRQEWPALLMVALAGVPLNQIFFILGLKHTSVAHSALLIGTTPILVLLLAAFLGQEKITAWKMIGLLTAFVGIGVLDYSPAKGSGVTMLGDLYAFLAAVAFALFTVFGKRATETHGSISVNTLAYAGGALVLVPVTLWEAWGFSFGRVSATAWTSLAYMALFPSLVCYLIFYYALTFIPASRLSAFSYVQPLLATTGAALFLDEPVTAMLVTGGALILTGVYLTERA